MSGGNKGKTVFITPDGGTGTFFINDTGAPSVKGYAVRPSATVDKGVRLIAQNIPDIIGYIYDDGVPDGELVRVVTSGITPVYFTSAVVRDQFCRGFVAADAGFVAGQMLNEPFPTSPFASDKHFYEGGHSIETTAGPGLALVNIHFN